MCVYGLVLEYGGVIVWFDMCGDCYFFDFWDNF